MLADLLGVLRREIAADVPEGDRSQIVAAALAVAGLSSLRDDLIDAGTSAASPCDACGSSGVELGACNLCTSIVCDSCAAAGSCCDQVLAGS